MLKHIPNILTMLRFFLIPFEVYFLITNKLLIAMIVILSSGLTDILDGTIARKFNLITNFGKLIDPLADKITQISLLFCLVVKNIIPLWIVIIVLIKEAAMVAGASFLYGKDLVVSSKWYGKAATVLFYTAIVLSLIINIINPASSALKHIDIPLYILALISTIFSLVMYFRAFYLQGYLKKESLKLNTKIEKEEL